MKIRNVMLIIILFLVTATVFAQAKSGANLVGRWEGRIDIPEMPLNIILHFDYNQDGELYGLIDIPQQGAHGLPLINLNVNGSKAAFEIADVPGNPHFEGEVSVDGTTLKGKFNQNNQIFPFEVSYEDPEEAANRVAKLREDIDLIKTFADSMLDVWDPPGYAFGVVYKDSVVFADGYGYRDLEDSLPANKKTLYAIGSTTKAFTTAAMGILVDEGILDWNGKVVEYLPDFRLWDEYATCHINLTDLVTHRSGLPRHDLVWYNSPLTREEIIDRLKYLEPTAELRTRFQYNNLMFVVAGYIVGQVSGMGWEDFIQTEIFDPLGMERTNFSVNTSIMDNNHAQPYRNNAEGEVVLTDFRNIDNVGPAGCINSSVTDMCQWLRLQLGMGEYNGFRIISEDQVNLMHTGHITDEASSEYPELSQAMYGLGWVVQWYRGHKMVTHNGGIDGFYAKVVLFPDDDLGIVAFVNLPGNFVIDAVSYYVVDRFLDLEPIDWTSRLKRTGNHEEKQKTKNEMDEERVKGTKPSHKLKDYAGQYEHPAYGKITIVYRDKKLFAEFNQLETELEHWHYDVFMATAEIFDKTKIQFLTNNRGDINRLGIPLEPELDDIIFIKQADAHLFDPEFLLKLTGEYELEGVVSRVYFKNDNTIGLTVPGQPPYTLVPYRGNEFNIEGLNGFSVRFKIDDDDEFASQATFIQPNGVFIAKRK